MKYDPNRIPKIVIPLAIAAWLGGVVMAKVGVPAIVDALLIVAFVIAVPVAVFYLIGESGWRRLASHYKAGVPYEGKWTMCPTGQMALVNVDHQDFNKVKMRFVGGALSVAVSPEALHLRTMASGLPILGWFFPALQIPWTAVTKAHAFEAPGWFGPASEPGTLLQIGYDPNYTGKFIEMEIGEPPVFVQLSAEILGEGLSRLRLTTAV